MAKKRNYENDEAYKNFRVEDFLPEMKWREPEAKDSTTKETDLFLSMDEPGTSAAQAAVAETSQPDEQEVWEDDVETGDTDVTDNDEMEGAVPEVDVPEERTIVRRISSKQRRLSLEEYRTTYLQVPKITDRKPVFLSGEIRDRLDEIVDLMLETVCTARKRVRIAGDDYPAELVKSKFMKLDGEHIRFVLDCMRENTTKIRNIKQYLKAALFNAPSTIGNYYTSLVAHDMASGALSPKKPQYGDPDYYSCNEGESL